MHAIGWLDLGYSGYYARHEPAGAPEANYEWIFVLEHHEIPFTVSLPQLLVDGHDDLFREMVSVLGSVSNQSLHIRSNQSEKLRRAHGIDLTAAEVSFLWAVVKTADSNRSTTIRHIARYTMVSPAAVSATLNNLTRKRFLEKRVDPVDSRRHYIHLTSEGLAAIRVSADEQRKVNDIQFDGMAMPEMLELIRLLGQILEKGNQVLQMQERDSLDHVGP